jgi:hypothetical protein
MAAASGAGVIIGFEINIGSYYVTEWEVRLNPDLNIIPYNFGVSARGNAKWRRTSRIVPLFSWLQERLKSIDQPATINTDYMKKVSLSTVVMIVF